jgi:signal transduction histidine kinase/CheY-like chemotaxis protein
MAERRQQQEPRLHFLANAGSMGALMQACDWSKTPIGPVDGWPKTLQTAVSILLTSRFAMWLGWGSELTFLYNDAYAPTLGVKHPWALGRPSREVWAEIWEDIEPRIDQVLRTGEATWDEALLLFLERRGFPEETYHTFSYSPLRGDDHKVMGHLCVVSEETERVIGERRLRLLRELAAAIAETRTPPELFAAAAQCLAAHRHDLPFSLTYLFEEEGKIARLVCASGFADGHPATPVRFAVDAADAPWPAARVSATAAPVMVGDFAANLDLPTGPWSKPPGKAIVLPIAQQGQTDRAGVFIAGINPNRPFDSEYQGFLTLVAGQIAAGLAAAQAYEAERRRAEALAEIDRAKTIFFSNASHEFRTPLTLILSPIEDLLLRSGGSPTVAAERAEVELMHRNGLRLLKLVNTLLDFSGIEAGRIEAVYEPVDLAAFTAELASAFRSAMERAGLRYAVDCQPLPQPIFVARDMWEKIVLNLLSNAFKYTFDGEVAVRLRPVGTAAVELKIRDTGVGIPGEELPRLFERFHRVEGRRGRTQEGTGIGLALVNELVRLHRGTVTVASKPGLGSEFTVVIPTGSAHLPAHRIGGARLLAATEIRADAFVEEALRWLDVEIGTEPTIKSPPISFIPAADISEAGDRPIVLLADDNADMRDYVRRLLAHRYQVVAVADGVTALSEARRRRPDLILSDVMMPQPDGFGLLRAVRNDAALREIPFIILSARAGEEASVDGMTAGADDYLTKPFAARERTE